MVEVEKNALNGNIQFNIPILQLLIRCASSFATSVIPEETILVFISLLLRHDALLCMHSYARPPALPLI